MADEEDAAGERRDGDGDGDAQRHAFAVLQDKYVHARRLACCPTMDLVAVLTVDGQLIVHRLLHVKPSEVSFEIATIEWSPDGLHLALGCDEGEVVVYEIESGEQRAELRALKQLHELQHNHAIAAMHWAECIQKQQQEQQSQSHNQSYFGHRARRFLQPQSHSHSCAGGSNAKSAATVLVTADASGEIVLWWMGKIYLAKIDIKSLYTQSDATEIAIDSVRLAPDLSRLFIVLLVNKEDSDAAKDVEVSSSGNTKLHTTSKTHQLVTLDLYSIRQIQEEINFMAQMVDDSHEVLNQLVLSMRQMATEWKNAMRIFELKMGLIGSLYEKYACEDPPQVDMLSVVASGITSPALAQYFAQDIQEMSVDRMQKLLLSGCQTLTTLIEDKMKKGLVKLLFHLSELRGRAKWQRAAFEGTFGVAMTEIDDLITITQDSLISMEIFSHAVHETRQDFVLFFQWILERIRIHTNSNTSHTGSASDPQGDATKSLLNQRRLCNFLQRAAEEAHKYRDEQPPTNKYRVETSFGNLVSKQLAKPKTPSNEGEASGILLLERLETKWFAMVKRLTQSVAGTISIDPTGCFNLGDDVDEYYFHYRQESDATDRDEDSMDDEESEEEDDEDEMEAVDWSSLKSFALTQNRISTHSLLLLGIRLRTNQLLLLRANWSLNPQDQSKRSLFWEAMKLAPRPSTQASEDDIQLRGFHFYGDKASGKKEQLAFLLTKTVPQDGSHQQQDWLYFQPYDQLTCKPLKIEAEDSLASILPELLKLIVLVHWQLVQLPTTLLPMSGKYRTRQLTTSSSAASAALIPRVIANAKREDDDDDEDDGVDDDEQEGGEEETPSDHHHKGHESDSYEVDL